MKEASKISFFSTVLQSEPQVKLQIGEVYLGRTLFRGGQHSLIRNSQGLYILDNGTTRYEISGSGTKKIDQLLMGRGHGGF